MIVVKRGMANWNGVTQGLSVYSDDMIVELHSAVIADVMLS